MTFSLTENAFARLGVSARARLVKIDEAFEDAVIDKPEREAELLALKQILVSPKPRLETEVRWLLDLAPRKVDQVIEALRTGDLEASLRFLKTDVQGLSAANVAADAAVRFSDIRFVDALIEAHTDITVDAVFEELRSVRAASGFPGVTASSAQEVLARLRGEHARSAVEAVVAQPALGEALDAILARHTSPFMDELMRAFDEWAGPRLGELEDSCRDVLSVVEETGQADFVVLERSFRAWQAISRPLQTYSARNGLDEPRSLRLYAAVRNVAVDLANDHGVPDKALELTNLLAKTFGDLPTASTQLAKDLDDLEELCREHAQHQKVRPLNDQAVLLAANLAQTASLIEQEAWLRPGLRQLDDAFASTIRQGGLDDQALGIVRDLSLQLNNAEHSRAALILLTRYRNRSTPRSADFNQRVENDIATLKSNCDHNELVIALERKDTGKVREITARMLGYVSDPDVRDRLSRLHAAADQVGRNRTSKIVWWGIAAAVVVGIGTFNSMDSGTSSYGDASYDSGSQTYADPGPEFSTSAPDDPATSDGSFASDYPPSPAPDAAAGDDPSMYPAEVAPSSMDGGLVLSAIQIENCLAEEARLDHLKNLVFSDTAIDRFNLMVNAYNAQCGSYRYRLDDMERARSAVAGRAVELRMQAETLAREWGSE